MKGLIQRVSYSEVFIQEKSIGKIEQGLLALVGIEPKDDYHKANKLLQKILHYRIFSDDSGKMNLSLKDINGGLLLVSQFTLVADTQKGLRPSFSKAASPEHGKDIFDYLLSCAHQAHSKVESGIFGANMKINITNDGPVTFLLEV